MAADFYAELLERYREQIDEMLLAMNAPPGMVCGAIFVSEATFAEMDRHKIPLVLLSAEDRTLYREHWIRYAAGRPDVGTGPTCERPIAVIIGLV